MMPSCHRLLTAFLRHAGAPAAHALSQPQIVAGAVLRQQQQQQLPTSAAASYFSQASGNSSYAYGQERMRATTILCVRKDGQVVLIGDGQVSQGDTIVKPNAKKVRRIGDTVICGFAGSAADGLTLLERLETKLEEHPGQLLRAAVELAKVWRQDKALRFLQAEILVADATTTLTVSGNGDVLEPQDGIMAIGSGGRFAVAAARALMTVDTPGHALDAHTIAMRSMKIASEMCVYTNNNFIVETLSAPAAAAAAAEPGSSSSGAAAATTDAAAPLL